MTARDYKLVADAIKDCVEIYHTPCPETIAQMIAKYMREENGRFKPNIFLSACGFPQSEE